MKEWWNEFIDGPAATGKAGGSAATAEQAQKEFNDLVIQARGKGESAVGAGTAGTVRSEKVAAATAQSGAAAGAEKGIFSRAYESVKEKVNSQVEKVKEFLAKGGEGAAKEGAKTVGAGTKMTRTEKVTRGTVLATETGTAIVEERKRLALARLEKENERKKELQELAQGQSGTPGTMDSAEAQRVKAMESKDFLNHVRQKIADGASNEEIREIFGYKGLTNISPDTWRNQKGLFDKDKKGRYTRASTKLGEKMLLGEFAKQENIDASMKAGKAVDVGKEMANLTDKYALAWKASGKDFTSSEQRVAIAARQNGATDATTFEEMKHYFDEGDQYGEKQVELLAKIAAELKNDDKWKDKSDAERMDEAKRRRREQFIEKMTAQDLHNRFKYDENGKEIKDEEEINRRTNEFFKANNIERSFEQEFEPEQIKQFKAFMGSDEAKGNRFSLNLAKFGDKMGISRSDVRTLAAKAYGLENLDEEQRNEVMKSPAVKKMVANKKAADNAAKRQKLGEEKSKTIDVEEATKAFKGDRERAELFIEKRDKVANGGKLNKNEQSSFELDKKLIGYYEWQKTQKDEVGSSERKRVRPRTTRKGHNTEALDRWRAGYEERKSRWENPSPRVGRTLRGKELLAERAKRRKEEEEKRQQQKNDGGASSTTSVRGKPTGNRTDKGLTLGKSAGKPTLGTGGKLTLGTGGKLTLGKEPHTMSLGARGRGGKLTLETSSYKPERAPSRVYNPSKVMEAETAAASGNRARNGGMTSDRGSAGSKDGGAQTFNTTVNFTANLNGVDLSNADSLKKVLNESAGDMATKINEAIAAAQNTAIRNRGFG